jgi:hypothetical protein
MIAVFSVCVIVVCLLSCCLGQTENGAVGGISSKTSKTNMKAQRAAVKSWANSLSEPDFDPDHWLSEFNTDQPQNYFEQYAKRLSSIFSENDAFVHFALVGACDGTHDATIRDLYLPHPHWRGVFVEPFEMNFNDLKSFMDTHGVAARTVVLHAAATRLGCLSLL